METAVQSDMKGMRVDQRNLTGAAGAETSRAQEAQSIGRDGRAGTPGRGGAGLDQVELSPLSRALSSSAAARSDRVAQLAAQYQAGRYQADPAQVGQSMLADALAAPEL